VRIYVDAAALTVASATGGRASLAPGAADALGMLGDAGHEVVIVGRPAEAKRLGTLRLPRVDDIPEDERDAWFLTGDPHTCDVRPRGCRTVFVGPMIGQRTLPTRHCDDEVRDVNQAALLVLAADVMPAT
jgi:hypothetical protein